VLDYMILLADRLGVGDYSLHLGAAAFDDARGLLPAGAGIEPELAAAACLKLADAYDEHSQEYYQRERATAYHHAAQKRWPVAALLEAEKRLAQVLDFQLRRPTVCWFLRACAHAGGRDLVETPGVISQARFITDLGLLDTEAQAHPAALRAQVALLLAVHCTVRGPPAAGRPGSGLTEQALRLWWPVRCATCRNNQRERAALCLMRTLHAVLARRERWGARGLRAVERRHPEAARRPMPPQGFPGSLAEELLPASGPCPA